MKFQNDSKNNESINKTVNVNVGAISNWLYSPIEYKGEIYIYDDWYSTLSKLVLIVGDEFIEIFNDSDYFTVIEHAKGKYGFNYIELIDEL